MVPHHAPGIGTGSYPLDDFEGFRSFTDQVSDEIEVIIRCETYLRDKGYELIIATMNITDEESTFHVESLSISE